MPHRFSGASSSSIGFVVPVEVPRAEVAPSVADAAAPVVEEHQEAVVEALVAEAAADNSKTNRPGDTEWIPGHTRR